MTTKVRSVHPRRLWESTYWTRRLLATDLINGVSNSLGDTHGGRRLRRALLRAAGADIHPTAAVYGGTFIARPRNLRMESASTIERGCFLDLAASVVIGSGARVSHGVTMITTEHEIGSADQRVVSGVEGRGIAIGRGAWVGPNATILPGVEIGSGAVVAACALVRNSVPPNVLVTGSPARLERRLDAEHDVEPMPTISEVAADAMQGVPGPESRAS